MRAKCKNTHTIKTPALPDFEEGAFYDYGYLYKHLQCSPEVGGAVAPATEGVDCSSAISEYV
ncbi:MAG: hypothetical protein Phog2KO_11560 [Phototrophicaceae bacterium]